MSFSLPEFSFFLRRYQPAGKQDATEHLTTIQVQEIIVEHAGEAVGVNQVFTWLTEEGFEECGLGGNEFYWMLKEK